MDNPSLSQEEYKFLEGLIGIESTGSSAVNEPGKGTLPYGSAPFSALNFFLDDASNAGMRTGIIENRVGWCEFGPMDADLIGIVCHLDVVPAGDGWNTSPFELTLKDGILYGRGIVDDKGPACASYFAMKRLMASGFVPSKRIRLILGTDEERTCSCVETYAELGEIPSFAITPDAEFPVIYAEKGILHVKIVNSSPSTLKAEGGSAANMVPASCSCTIDGVEYSAKGKMAHASKPELGVNAIFELIKQLDTASVDYSNSPLLSFISKEIVYSSPEEYTGCSITDESGNVTANPSVLNCSDSGESLVIDIRCPVTYKMSDIVAKLSDTAKSYGLTVEVLNQMDPLYKSKDLPQIALLTEIWKSNMPSYSGYKPEYLSEYTEPIAIGGGTYARHMPNTIAFGIQAPWQEDQCHQANECRALSDFETDIKVMTEAIMGLSEYL
ncbi:MAG: Sapep family Mn(2+)-dependent dipeptidase [Eubacteriales bacterium]|nr:Sapep family Mn(2+)-dependent dipeptidase [Eubacteriales bacterium]